MKIIKNHLANIEHVYAITLITINNDKYCLAASEDKEGKSVLINLQNNHVRMVEGLSGGVMSIVDNSNSSVGGYYAIQKFYPVFQSKDAEIIHFTIDLVGDGPINANIDIVAKLPFVHRIYNIDINDDESLIVAGTLCNDKAYEQDWSKPGYVWLIPNNKDSKPRKLDEAISKHHGMYYYESRDILFVTGEEGVFALNHKTGKDFSLSKELNAATSDVCFFDLDDDGIDEMITIEPFHGNEICIYKSDDNKWQKSSTLNASFCHAIWGGKIDGKSSIIACNRGGNRDIVLYQNEQTNKGEFDWNSILIDKNVGTANMVVLQKDNKTYIYAANHYSGEVAVYELENENP